MTVTPASSSPSPSDPSASAPAAPPTTSFSTTDEWSDPEASLTAAQQLVANTQQYQTQLQIANSSSASSAVGQTAAAYVEAYHAAQVFISTFNDAQRISTTSSWYKMLAPYINRTMKNKTTGALPDPKIVKLMVYQFIFSFENATVQYIKKIEDSSEQATKKMGTEDAGISGDDNV